MYSSYSSYPSTYSSYGSSSASSKAQASAIGGAIAAMGGMIFVYLLVIILFVVAMAFVFKKAGKKWYESLIAGHNSCVLLELAGLPMAYYFLYLVPIANIVIYFMQNIKLANAFGKSSGFGVGLALLPVIFYPILAWGNATYVGPNAAPTTTSTPPPAQ